LLLGAAAGWLSQIAVFICSSSSQKISTVTGMSSGVLFKFKVMKHSLPGIVRMMKKKNNLIRKLSMDFDKSYENSVTQG
jgi:hypothetical protein